MTEFKNLSNKSFLQYENDPLQNFLYALKAPDSKRQYPRRFEYFLDYLRLKGTLKEKCLIFYQQTKKDAIWTQYQIMQYIEYQKERVEKGEIKDSTGYSSHTFKALFTTTLVSEKKSFYSVVYFSSPATFDHHLPTVEKMIKSFQIIRVFQKYRKKIDLFA